jgi:hypothetical protein
MTPGEPRALCCRYFSADFGSDGKEIARATNDYQNFNEIMPMVYKRFAESGKNWRQVYKVRLLDVLLYFLICFIKLINLIDLCRRCNWWNIC